MLRYKYIFTSHVEALECTASHPSISVGIYMVFRAELSLRSAGPLLNHRKLIINSQHIAWKRLILHTITCPAIHPDHVLVHYSWRGPWLCCSPCLLHQRRVACPSTNPCWQPHRDPSLFTPLCFSHSRHKPYRYTEQFDPSVL